MNLYGQQEERVTMKGTYEAIRKNKQPVHWHKMVWFKYHIPRRAFIAWLAFRTGLKTLKRMREWKVVQSDTCVLCWDATETKNHMFHECRFTRQVWRELKIKAGYRHS